MKTWRVETKAGWFEFNAKDLRAAKVEALNQREESKAATGSRYCLLLKRDARGRVIGEWKMSNVRAGLNVFAVFKKAHEHFSTPSRAQIARAKARLRENWMDVASAELLERAAIAKAARA
jgi:hypothetical protein